MGLGTFNKNYGLAFFIALFAATTASACQPDKITIFTNLLKNVSPVWSEYNIKNIPALLIDNDENQHCVFALQNGVIKNVGTVPKWNKTLSGHSFIPDDETYKNYPGLRDATKGNQLDGAGVLGCCGGIGDFTSIFSNMIKDIHVPAAFVFWFAQDTLPNAVTMAWDLVRFVHEAFHYFYQNRGLSKTPWPKLEYASNDILENCYQNEKLLQPELDALLNAYKFRKTKSSLNKYLAEFIALRKQRYQEQINCETVEANMEYLEGVPEFVGQATMLQTKSLGEDYYLNYLQNNLSISSKTILYYNTGLLQLLLLQEIHKNDFIAITKKISENEKPVALYKFFND